jgi:hypothetical protein
MSESAPSELTKKPNAPVGDITNVLQHIKALEDAKVELENRLRQSENRAERMSVKTRESMQAAMDTLMKKWMDVMDTKDEVVKTQFKTGLDKLINHSVEENGVWQMMVAASAGEQPGQAAHREQRAAQQGRHDVRLDGVARRGRKESEEGADGPHRRAVRRERQHLGGLCVELELVLRSRHF